MAGLDKSMFCQTEIQDVSERANRSPATDMRRRLDAIRHMIGDTPLVQLKFRIGTRVGTILAKYESENMTGSIKDRMAWYTLHHAVETGQLHEGSRIVEASSGNTGISFAALGAALGLPVRIYMPNWMSSERVNLIRSFGAEVIPVSREQGGFVGAVEMAEAHAQEEPDVFLPRQFDNPLNVEAHRTWTGVELIRQIESLGETPDAFVAGVGTGGSVMGIGGAMRHRWSDLSVHPLEPANSPTMRTGSCVGKHRIQGISDEFIPSIVKLKELDEIVDVWDGDAILMAQKLCRSLGLAVGISSGANIVGAVRLVMEGNAHTIATLLPDSNKKYLTTDLSRNEPVLDHYLTPQVEFTDMNVIR